MSYSRAVVTVSTVGGGTTTTRGSFIGIFSSGDRLAAVALPDGTVNVYKNATADRRGPDPHHRRRLLGAGCSGAQRIGVLLPSGGRIDNFSGGTVA